MIGSTVPHRATRSSRRPLGLLDARRRQLRLSLLLKVAFVLGLFFVVPLVGGYLEHKAMGRMQHRRGPVEAGPFGSLQLVADGIKFIQKEDIIPRPPTSGCSRSPRGRARPRRC
jgi:hypothetical protein